MRIHLIAVGTRMPEWVQEGYREYAGRMPPACALRLIEVAPGRRGKRADVARAVREEGERMLAAIPPDSIAIALEVEGQSWSTESLSQRLADWLQSGHDVALLVGGPDGLDESCRRRAELRWSLSALTLPHPLVRVVVAEQIYRAWSVLQGHPYHRAG